jgi:hypothetical protein
VIDTTLRASVQVGRARGAERLAAHRAFIEARVAAGKDTKHTSLSYGFPVITGQERSLLLLAPARLELTAEGAWIGTSAPLDAGPTA